MKIGSRVKVINQMLQWTDSVDFFEKMGFKNPNNSRDLIKLKDYEKIKFTIFSKVINPEGGFLYGIIDEKGNQFLIEEEGLQKIKKSKKAKEEPIQEEEVKEKPFPKVMKSIYSDLHVFFESEKIGQVVISDDGWHVGHISREWAMHTFEDIKEPITITITFN